MAVEQVKTPVEGGVAFGYGALQLGSWIYNGKSVEENIESIITKP